MHVKVIKKPLIYKGVNREESWDSIWIGLHNIKYYNGVYIFFLAGAYLKFCKSDLWTMVYDVCRYLKGPQFTTMANAIKDLERFREIREERERGGINVLDFSTDFDKSILEEFWEIMDKEEQKEQERKKEEEKQRRSDSQKRRYLCERAKKLQL